MSGDGCGPKQNAPCTAGDARAAAGCGVCAAARRRMWDGISAEQAHDSPSLPPIIKFIYVSISYRIGDRQAAPHHIGALWAGPDDGPSGPSRFVIDARGVMDDRSGRYGPCRLAHMQGASVVTSKDGGGASPPFQGSAKGHRTQAGADHLHGLVGDNGDGQAAPGPARLAVAKWGSGRVRIRGIEDRFDVGRGNAGAPQDSLVPIDSVEYPMLHSGPERVYDELASGGIGL